MDNDRQIPLKFLDEAADCCDRIESTVLGLASKVPDPQALDLALRAAHSIKGGAGMMGFMPLSQVAHQLEDFFKILRVRYHSKSIHTEIETLLLQGVDCLRLVSDLHRQGQVIDEVWLANQSQPIFDRLRQHLGELRPEDEDALLSQEGDVDPALLMLESALKESIDLLGLQVTSISPSQLLQSLQATAAELTDFGRMAKLEQFVDLCRSVKNHSQNTDLTQVVQITQQALKAWRTAHSVLLLGRFEKIPTQIAGCDNIPELLELDRFNPGLSGLEGLTESIDLSLFQADFANLGDFSGSFDELQITPDLLGEFANFEVPELPTTFITPSDESATEQSVTRVLAQEQPSLELLSELAAFDLPGIPAALVINWDEPSNEPEAIAPVKAVVTPAPTSTVDNRQTVRVPVEYLQQFNTVVGQLILERNAINLRLSEIQGYTGLLRKRMKHLESSNQELRQWYDSASTAGLIPAIQSNLADTAPLMPQAPSLSGFDALEMDQYNDLHLVSQDQMETIVQLQEVTTDIELSLQDMTQSVRGLNQTTRNLQKNLTRTQMLPFADLVKRFPRLIRDLSVQFGKSVNLKIVGEHVGIDRAVLDNLSDPLIHLLRNAFDHGIEDVATRLAAGKSTTGTIVLEAIHRGGETIITISDDGGGIKVDRIRDRLQQMGLPSEEIAKISEAELLDTIFEPGFSTASSLTELSGRGVGMDVVRTNIEEIRGVIQVKTQPGVGTTFTLRVPFALSIVRVMLLERAGFVFAVSVDAVQEIIRFQADLLTTDGSQISWQSQTISIIALEQEVTFGRNQRPFELPGVPIISQPTVLVVGEDKLSAAFYIDRFWGEQEVTLRSIDSPLPLTPGFGNSIILGDGRVVPLVNLVQLACWMSVKADHQGPDDGAMPVVIESSQPDRVLVIDDSINVRRYLAAMLEKAGYEVEQARDGQEAVEKLVGGLVVQAAICDVEMPRLDGYGVLEALRADEAFASLPIVMLTSRNSDKHRSLAMNLGASAYFSKPYTESELLATLQSLIIKE
jgi:two-component system, chemotaxis family, sensor histidine kinase and response regulator PixL